MRPQRRVLPSPGGSAVITAIIIGSHESGALRMKDLARVTVGTTVQPKNITFPTDAKRGLEPSRCGGDVEIPAQRQGAERTVA